MLRTDFCVYSVNHLATAAAVGSTILVMAPLIAIFAYLLFKGASSLNVAFFTQVPKPVGEVGGRDGQFHPRIGYPARHCQPHGRAHRHCRRHLHCGVRPQTSVWPTWFGFTADVLNGVPSIVMGIAVYTLIVVPQKHFSALSGGVALGIMMIPTITRTTEEMLLMVPLNVREAALGFGCAELAFGSFHHPAHRVAGRHYRLHAGLCPGGGRDRAAALYRVRKPVLE